MDDRKKQIDEMRKDLIEIFDEEYEKRRLITADFTAIQLSKKGYRKQSVGEWNENLIGFCNVCMSCGAIVERSAIKNNSGKLNFCPNCGARMKGDEGK